MFTPIEPVDEIIAAQAIERWNSRAKPVGSLGQIENVATKLAQITQQCPPPVPKRPVISVFAADHGIVKDGASLWPQEVTALMAEMVGAGQAAINTFATSIGAELNVIDVGMISTDPIPNVTCSKIGSATQNIVTTRAMTIEEAIAATQVGFDHALTAIEAGADCLIGGELGIGNTTASAAIIAALTDSTPADITGTGAGVPERGLNHKIKLIADVINRRDQSQPEHPNPGIDLLSDIGGYEICALAGFYIAAAQKRIPFITDGVISLAALMAAEEISNGVKDYAIAGHRSSEPAASVALEKLDLEPLVDLELRLGEGTGAALAFPLVQAAAQALRDMAQIPDL